MEIDGHVGVAGDHRWNRHHDAAAFGREALEQVRREPVAESGLGPRRSVPQDDHPSFPWIGAAAAAVETGVDEQQCVARPGVDGLGVGEVVHPIASGVVADTRVGEVRLVAAGHDHRRTVTRPDVGEGDEDVELSAAEPPVAHRELRPDRRVVAAGVSRVMAAGGANRGDVLVDRDALHVRALLAGVATSVVDPGRMIDEHVEGGVTAVEQVVQFEPRVGGVVASLRVAVPLAVPELREPVDGTVEAVEFVGVERAAHDEEAAQVEFVVVERGRWHHCLIFVAGCVLDKKCEVDARYRK